MSSSFDIFKYGLLNLDSLAPNIAIGKTPN
mgnify:CR=1 FL=1